MSTESEDRPLPLAVAHELAIPFRRVTDADSLASVLTLAARREQPDRHPKWQGREVQPRTVRWYLTKHKERYRPSFLIPKRAGGSREIKAPERGLLTIQRLLLVCMRAVLLTRERTSPNATPNEYTDLAAHGFTAGRSVVTNAQPHVGRAFVYNLDLRNFFPSIHYGRVVAVLQLPPFGLRPEAAQLVANLCTDRTAPREENKPGQASLPQGAPTSPLLSNLVCQRLDRRLRQLARKNGCFYTRYADDLTFSADRAAFTKNFRDELIGIITAEKFENHPEKERIQRPWQKQEVTGIVVNEKPNVSRQFILDIRRLLYLWQTKGEAEAKKRHQQYPTEAGHARANRPASLRRSLAGKIAYLAMVRGVQDLLYVRLRDQFHDLSGRTLRDAEDELAVMLLAQAATGAAGASLVEP